MKVVVLAGGFGTRLQSVINDVPKPMAPIQGIPFLQIVFDKLLYNGVTEIIVCVSYLKEKIMDYFGESYKGIPIRYSVEDEPLGTGGAIKQAFDLYSIESAIVINGDTFLDINLQNFFYKNKDKQLSLVLRYVDDAARFGTVLFDEEKVLSFLEKRNIVQSGFINGGIYFVNKDIFLLLNDRKSFSFEVDVLEQFVKKLTISYFISNDYFIDIGIPESYFMGNNELISIVYPNKALFLDRDGVVNIEKNYVHTISECEFVDGIFDLCRYAKLLNYKLIIITNQAGIAKGLYSEDDFCILMNYISLKFKEEKCPLDGIFFCPYHIEGKGKYKKDSIDRKPNPGMIWKASIQFKLNLKESVLVGDNETDIQAGINAGIKKTVLFHQNKISKNAFFSCGNLNEVIALL